MAIRARAIIFRNIEDFSSLLDKLILGFLHRQAQPLRKLNQMEKPKSFIEVKNEVSLLDSKAIILRSDLLQLKFRCQESNPKEVNRVEMARKHVIAAQERLAKALKILS